MLNSVLAAALHNKKISENVAASRLCAKNPHSSIRVHEHSCEVKNAQKHQKMAKKRPKTPKNGQKQ
ncbi:MAG TPA: hypothetical protein PKM67_07050 [Kiritimatiellia bacterium]|nr:hypothetical protein [Kiritimatiellia bacterium]